MLLRYGLYSNDKFLSIPQDPSTSVDSHVEHTLSLLLSLLSTSSDHQYISTVTPRNHHQTTNCRPKKPPFHSFHRSCLFSCLCITLLSILTLLHSRRHVSLVFGSSGVGRRHNGVRVSEFVEVCPGVVKSSCQKPGVGDLCVLVEFVSDLDGLLSKQLSVGNPVSGQLERLSVHGRDQLLVGLGKGHGVGHLLARGAVRDEWLSLPGSLYCTCSSYTFGDDTFGCTVIGWELCPWEKEGPVG